MKLAIIAMLVINTYSCTKDVLTDTNTENPEDKKLSSFITIPPGGNSWVVNDASRNEIVISDSGIHNWTDLNTIIRTYFKTDTPGKIDIGIKVKSPSGSSVLKVTVGRNSKKVKVTNADYQIIKVGTFEIESPGYTFIEIQGVAKEGTHIGDISEILIGGAATKGQINYVKDDFYWGRRGPSVHLGYSVPATKNVLWFYNEVTVPRGEDVQGSYYMANGFGQGYFGIQVNSESERRVLFSVWSPYDTQNPDEIPEDYKIILLGKGDGVTTGEFGNEGSGGQSYLRYNWKTGNTYKFLLKAEPSVNNSTDYTAYFYAPETGEWKLIASFRRPYTSTYLTNLYSFLENFRTETGYLPRMAKYSNQWIYDTDKNWTELNKAKFTIDATGRSGNRLDYAGGADGNTFFMKNCGFFSKNTKVDTYHERTKLGIEPDIDFEQLPIPTLPEDPNYLDKTNWEVLSYSSQATNGEGENGLASLVIDGNNATYWHSCWSGCNQEYLYPHDLTIDMNKLSDVDGLSFSQRNGSRKVKNFEIQISRDNNTWESAGNFILEDSAGRQQIDFPERKSFRYFRFIAKSAHDNNRFAAMAEIDAYVK